MLPNFDCDPIRENEADARDIEESCLPEDCLNETVDLDVEAANCPICDANAKAAQPYIASEASNEEYPW